jgi:CDP-4-dehydro-6-deoxyglucose reductase
MPLNQYSLIEKKSLTSDIFELTFQAKESFDFISGQFITFILPGIWGRAYSVLKTHRNKITLIIKKRSSGNWGRGWSNLICDLNIWNILNGTNPAGHFTLQNNNKNKLFIWTWTWFVPLYNQIIHSIQNNQDCNLTLLFWARTLLDLFYITELEKLKSENNNFNFEVFISREENTTHNSGYVTDYLTEKNIQKSDEFYICWIPVLIDSSLEILTQKWIKPENIFTEKY